MNLTKVRNLLETLGLLTPMRRIWTQINDFRLKSKRGEFYSQFIDKGDLCFDVGANIGNRTDIFLSLGAKVVCIEPQEICIRKLRKKYEENENVILIQKALGAEEGKGVLYLSDSSVISSMSKNWIERVKNSGRFGGSLWEGKQTVKIVTLDSLINKYGTPKFCKIDVEGFEYEVIKGLSKPIEYVSFEFASESLNLTFQTIKYLLKIGRYKFNYTLGEEMELLLDEWLSAEDIEKVLNRISKSQKNIWGDIYACCEKES